MKIAFINSVYKYGSTGRIVEDLMNLARSTGKEARVFYGRLTSSNHKTEEVLFEKKFEIAVHGVISRVFDRHGFGSKKATKRLIRLLEEYDPDIIHLHNLHGYYLHIEKLFGYLQSSEKHVIWTLHDCWPYTGHCAYYDYLGCYKWKNGCHSCQAIREYPRSFLVDNSKSNYYEKKRILTNINNLVIVTPSDWLRNEIRESFLSEHRAATIPNGVDLDIFYPVSSQHEKVFLREKYKINSRNVILGVANKWEKRKGLDYMIRLADQIRSDESAKVVIVGDSGKKIDHPNILHIKRTSNREMLRDFYCLSDFLVNPTLEDNFPTINIEALACGIPVITFNTGGSPESLNKECGIVVEKGNYEALLVAVKEYYINRPNALTCRERAKIYEKNSQYMEYIRLYEKIYGRGRMD